MFFFSHSPCMLPFTSDLDMLSGCLGGGVHCFFPSHVDVLQAFQEVVSWSTVVPSIHMLPFTNDLDVPSGCSDGDIHCLSSSPFLPGSHNLQVVQVV